MTYFISVLLSILLLSPVHADQFDYVLRFADTATARVDAQAMRHYLVTDTIPDWDHSHAMQVQVRRISTGVPIAGFFVLISLDHAEPLLLNHTALQVAINRDKCNAHQSGCMIRSTLGATILQDMMISPVFAGSNFPWGGFN